MSISSRLLCPVERRVVNALLQKVIIQLYGLADFVVHGYEVSVPPCHFIEGLDQFGLHRTNLFVESLDLRVTHNISAGGLYPFNQGREKINVFHFNRGKFCRRWNRGELGGRNKQTRN